MNKQNAANFPHNKDLADCNPSNGTKSFPIVIPNSHGVDNLTKEICSSYDCMDGVTSVSSSLVSSLATKALNLCPDENNGMGWDSKGCVTSVQTLKNKIDILFSNSSANIISLEELRSSLIQLLENVDLSTSELNKYTYWDTEKPYTRNLMATDNENYNLILLCWTPNRESKIHNHPCDTCYLKVVRGTIQESRYEIDLASNQVVQTSVKYVGEDQGKQPCIHVAW